MQIVAALVILAGVVSIILSAFEPTYDEKVRGELIAKIEELSVPGAIACGLIDVGDDPTSNGSCVRDAIRNQKPFWVVARAPIKENVWYLATGAGNGTKRNFWLADGLAPDVMSDFGPDDAAYIAGEGYPCENLQIPYNDKTPIACK